jgi:RNA polymerase sigma factor (sigma-70 family)
MTAAENTPRDLVRRLLEETLESGQLDRQLRCQHRRWRHLLDSGDFRDLVLSRVWQGADGFRGTTAEEFLAWVRRVGWSVAVDTWRQHKRETSLLARFTAFLPKFALPTSGEVETADLVSWLMADLSDRERKVLELRYFRGLTFKEIAEKLGKPLGSIAQLHYRALQRLRDRAKNRPEGP